MASSVIRRMVVAISSLVLFVLWQSVAYGQSHTNKPTLSVPAPLSSTLTPEQEAVVQSATTSQIHNALSILRPRILQRIQNHPVATGTFRPWQDILAHLPSADSTYINSSARGEHIHFRDSFGKQFVVGSATREYHPASASSVSSTSSALTSSSIQPLFVRPFPTDDDGDGLTDDSHNDSMYGGLEGSLAYEFMPVYHITNDEQQSLAQFGNYVPMTVTSLVNNNTPYSYYHVTPLGLGTINGSQMYAIRIDFLSLWNGDGGLIGGGAPCFYAYFGLDSVIQQVSGHDLDVERSVMLLAAPAVNGGINTNASAYNLYSLYTAAHEGTFFDQSVYYDFSTPVPPNSHPELYQSMSKHSTYWFDPDFYPITPAWLIESSNISIQESYDEGLIDYDTYLYLLAAANDTFFGCLVERYGDDQGPHMPTPIMVRNVGEVSHPLNLSGFIQDNSDRALNFASKLTNIVF